MYEITVWREVTFADIGTKSKTQLSPTNTHASADTGVLNLNRNGHQAVHNCTYYVNPWRQMVITHILNPKAAGSKTGLEKIKARFVLSPVEKPTSLFWSQRNS